MRVIVRPPMVSDADAFVEAAKRSRSLHAPYVEPPLDLVEFDRYLLRAADPRHAPTLVCSPSSSDIVGVVNINEIVRGPFQSGYLGYYAFAPYAGRGLMREGLRQAIQRAFSELGLHRLEANIQPDNHRSIALVHGLGFVKEGYSPNYLKIGENWRDHERWAIRTELWPPPMKS